MSESANAPGVSVSGRIEAFVDEAETVAQATLFRPRVRFTRPLQKARRRDALAVRLLRALRYFPELHDRAITVGVTRSADGIAVFETMTVRFDLRRGGPTHYTIGHELTHLLQALGQVPGGEVQCDIWTVARSRLFTDEVPCYLPLPAPVRRNWRRYALRVHYLCQRALTARGPRRTYIRWLRDELDRLG